MGVQVDEFNSKVKGFASRWSEVRPKGTPQGDPEVLLDKIKQYNNELAEFKEEAERIKKARNLN